MKGSIILFDGVCNLCNKLVNFIIKRDSKNIFQFAAIQSDTGQQLLLQDKLNSNYPYSLILIEGGRYYIRSTAILKIIKNLKTFWKLLYIFIIIPPFVRDSIYNYFAKNRYKWFGQRKSCKVPEPEFIDKFL